MSEFERLQAELERLVEEKRPSLEERLTFKDARERLGYARADAFIRATQKRGTPGCRGEYGTGKPPKEAA